MGQHPILMPTLRIETVGTSTFAEIAQLKEKIFGLQGDLSYVLLKERESRDGM